MPGELRLGWCGVTTGKPHRPPARCAAFTRKATAKPPNQLKIPTFTSIAILGLSFYLTVAEEAGTPAAEKSDKAIKALYVTGGGWHDYEGQIPLITKAMEEAVPGIEITVSMVKGHGGKFNKHPAFKEEDWSKGYDVVVYNMCNAPKFSDDEWIERIVKPHREGLPAVLIHGAMHNFWPDEKRTGQWNALCGVISRNHEPHAPVVVTVVEPDHETMKGLPKTWTNPQGELYRIAEMGEQSLPLAVGVSGEKKEHCVAWTSQIGKGRVFGTTLGHHNETIETPEFQRMIRQGLQWALAR